jgi:hypothetical protein
MLPRDDDVHVLLVEKMAHQAALDVDTREPILGET